MVTDSENAVMRMWEWTQWDATLQCTLYTCNVTDSTEPH